MKKVFAIVFVFIGVVGLSVATCCIPCAPPPPALPPEPPVVLVPPDASAPPPDASAQPADAALPGEDDAASCALPDAASDAGPKAVSPRVCVPRADVRELCDAVRPFCAP